MNVPEQKQIVTWYDYKNQQGELVGRVKRIDYPTKKKIIPHFRKNGSGFESGIPDELRNCMPLYGLPQLTLEQLEEQKKTIFFVEGEKSADAAKAMGLIALSAQGGANAAHKADYSPLSEVDAVYLLPDANLPGETYIEKAAEKINEVNPKAQLFIVRLPDLPDGGDIDDWIKAQGEVSVEDIRERLKIEIEDKRQRYFIETEVPEQTKKSSSRDGDEHKERVKAALTLEDILHKYGRNTEKHGDKYFCPLHEEDTPSFQDYPETKTFKCYGCGKQGDYFEIIAELEGISCTAHFPRVMQIAEEITGIRRPKPKTKRIPQKLGDRLPKALAEKITTVAEDSPDPELRTTIFDILTQKGNATEKRQAAGAILLDWLKEHGYFVKAEDNKLYYFIQGQRRLFSLDSIEWHAWLYTLTGANPSGTDFAYLRADCQTKAIFAEVTKVVRVAYFCTDTNTLHVSRYDGTVYKFDGETITEESNGETVFFLDDPLMMQSYSPDYSSDEDYFHKYASHYPYFEERTSGNHNELYGLMHEVWLLQAFFMELLPTRTILVWYGEKGSGKSTNSRIALLNLFGINEDVGGVPDKQDDFVAGAAGSHIYCLDNLDSLVPWMQDKLARLSTGGTDKKRKLYTTNEVEPVRYRCICTVTSRQPDTLKRDDLVDRVIMLPVVRPGGTQPVIRESKLLGDVRYYRNKWWGSVFKRLNQIVKALREGKLKDSSTLRMADFECFGHLYAGTQGKQELWTEVVEGIKEGQSNLLLEGDIVVEAIDKWLAESPDNPAEKRTARELWTELIRVLFGDKKPEGYLKNQRSFGRRLAGIRSNLQGEPYSLRWEKGTTTGRVGQWVYWFEQPTAHDHEIDYL